MKIKIMVHIFILYKYVYTNHIKMLNREGIRHHISSNYYWWNKRENPYTNYNNNKNIMIYEYL